MKMHFLLNPVHLKRNPISVPVFPNPPNHLSIFVSPCNPSTSPLPMAISITRPRHRSLANPSLIHLFSSSSSSSSQNDNDSLSPPPQHHHHHHQQEGRPQSLSSSYFRDVKATLKQPHHDPRTQSQYKFNFSPLRKPNHNNPSNSKPTTHIDSSEEIRRNLSEFRRRSAPPSPSELSSLASSSNTTSPLPSSDRQSISFHDLYQKSAKSGNTTVSGNKPSFDQIREHLKLIQPNPNTTGSRSGIGDGKFSGFRHGSKLNKEDESMKSIVLGGIEALPFPATEKDQGNVRDGGTSEFVRIYSHGELGEKLRSLRPEVTEREKGCFSLEELNERLTKLRQQDNEETKKGIAGYGAIRNSLQSLQVAKDDKKSKSARAVNIFKLGSTPKYMVYPPKQELVEKFFHPDNMSSAEKLKIELSKVREEFKLSESDCGSARVQVAQLTTKIKHLSSVLHKKDKHSRKGLQEMVQRRKQLLKYLRRTDWDSYCFVLSKLGLRDNPDFKYLARN